MDEPIVYLDNNATTRCAPEVVDAMLPFLAEEYGNAASPHLLGRQAARAVASARDHIAESIGCDPAEVYFTSGATESNNLVILGVAQTPGMRHKIVASAIEHKSVLGPCQTLLERGIEFETLPVRADGVVELDAARSMIDESTLLVSLQGANNEIGTIQPVKAVADIAHENGAAFHCDAAQLLGKIPAAVSDLGADFVSFSPHKAYGPKGIGLLIVRNQVKTVSISPLSFGGGQEKGLRPGTLNVPGIVGTGEACRLCRMWLKDDMDRIAALRVQLEHGIREVMPNSCIVAHQALRLPGTASVTFPGIPADVLIARTPAVCMSMGSACTSGTIAPSHVLLSLGLSRDEARCTVRFSLGRYNTAEDVQAALRNISNALSAIGDRGLTRPRDHANPLVAGKEARL
jgi:cysteine desulfurase